MRMSEIWHNYHRLAFGYDSSSLIGNNSNLFPIRTWRRRGEEPLLKPMFTRSVDVWMRLWPRDYNTNSYISWLSFVHIEYQVNAVYRNISPNITIYIFQIYFYNIVAYPLFYLLSFFILSKLPRIMCVRNDVIIWKLFLCYWPFVRRIPNKSPVMQSFDVFVDVGPHELIMQRAE